MIGADLHADDPALTTPHGDQETGDIGKGEATIAANESGHASSGVASNSQRDGLRDAFMGRFVAGE